MHAGVRTAAHADRPGPAHPGRRAFAGAALGAALVAGTRAVPAQTAAFPQPGRPIRLLVGLAAGGSLDFQARTIAQKVAEQSGVQVLVENKPGASMILAATEVARAAPDGHTLLYSTSSQLAQNPHTLLNVPYDPFRDFTPITMAARGPLVLTVHASMPARTVQELVAWGKANPGKLIFASFGVGTSSHVYAEAFAKAAGIEIVHVPYKGTADALRDLFEGRVQAYFDAAPTAISNAATGRIRMLGVAAPARNPFIPDVPTIGEQGVAGLDLPSWLAVLGPAKLPPEIVARLNTMFRDALNSAPVREAIARGAYETGPSTPEELAAEMRTTYDRWGAMIRAIGFQKQ
jgi:tripartite-type tricarboxylate transporter receptor subunit TctC